MKINDIVEGRIWQGVKDVGRGLGGIAAGVGVGATKALDKFAGGKGEVGVYGKDFGPGTSTPTNKQKNIQQSATALADMLKQYRSETYDEVYADLIKKGLTPQAAERTARQLMKKRAQSSQVSTQPTTPAVQPTPAQSPAPAQTTQSQTAVPVQQGFVTAVVAPTAAGDRKFWYDGKNWKEYFGSNWPQDIQTSQTVVDDKVISYLAKQVQLKNTEKVPYGTTKQAKRKS